jgi:hypothetical protein
MRLLNCPFRLSVLTGFAFVVVILCLPSTSVGAQQHALHILYHTPGTLKLTPTSSDKGFTHVVTASVLVRNDGPPINKAIFSVIIPNDNDEAACVSKAGVAACVSIPDSSDIQARQIDAFAVKRFNLRLLMNNPPDSLTAYLVVRDEKNEVIPGAMPVTLTNPVVSKVIALLRLSRFRQLSEGLVGLALAIAILVTLGTYGSVKHRLLWNDLLQVENGYSSSDSWASTLTGIGALLGTVLTAGVLPDETQTLSSESYAFLNVLFGMLILMAGLIYTIWHKKGVDAGKEQISVKVFLWLAVFTLWATLGELLTVVLLVGEMELHGTVSSWLFWGLLALLGLAFLGAIYYAWHTIKANVKAPAERPPSPSADEPAPPISQPGPKAALL